MWSLMLHLMSDTHVWQFVSHTHVVCMTVRDSYKCDLSCHLSWARLLYAWQFVTHVMIVTHIHTWHDVSHYTHSRHQTVCDVYTCTPQSVTCTHLRVRGSCNNCDAYTYMTWRVSLYTSTPCDRPWRIHIYTWDSVRDLYIFAFFWGGDSFKYDRPCVPPCLPPSCRMRHVTTLTMTRGPPRAALCGRTAPDMSNRSKSSKVISHLNLPYEIPIELALEKVYCCVLHCGRTAPDMFNKYKSSESCKHPQMSEKSSEVRLTSEAELTSDFGGWNILRGQ